ncbi:MAG: hypothetical protein QXZ25_00365 [Candidatus Bathyarchaeia archaeon]
MNFDVGMPLTLLIVTLVAMFLNEKVEGKLRGVLEAREFRVQDVIFFVAAISITVSIIVFIPRMAIMLVFLFAYSMLLFMFTYVFSDFQKRGAQLFFEFFLAITLLAAIVSLFNSTANIFVFYGALAFLGLFGFSCAALLYERKRSLAGRRWYLAMLPTALFICLYIFFSGTSVWFPFLLNFYGMIFAILIILYLGSLFTWKTSIIFAGLLTLVDVILVLFTGSMVSAARSVQALRLPMLISVPTVPFIMTERGILYMSLGLGDFFFAGLLAIQSMKKFGKNFALISVVAMCMSFFIFEALILNYELTAFPGTLMIICGWLPLTLWRSLKN